MAGFRDDREALLARLDALEGELARAGGVQERADLRRRVEELSTAVRSVTERMDRDRGALGDLGARLDALRGDLAEEPVATDRPPPQADPLTVPPPAPVAAPGFPAWKVVVPLVGLVFIGVLASRGVSSDRGDFRSAPRPAAPAGESLPGGLHAFDPIAGLALARERSPFGAAGLSSIRARYVSSNGRVDLDAASYQGDVEYELYLPGAAPEADPATPVGVARPLAMGQIATIRVTSGGIHVDPGMPFPIGRSLPEPRCSLEALWAVALSRGAPRDAVATISYGGTSDRGAWTFDITGTSLHFELGDAECVAAARPSEAAPPSP